MAQMTSEIGSEIGQLSPIRSWKWKHELEWTWTIEDIFAYTVVDAWYRSPPASIHGSEWSFRLFPNGATKNNSAGFISLYLLKHYNKHSISPTCAICTLGVKKACGTVAHIDVFNWVFGEDGVGFGRPKFLDRSELLRRKSELTYCGALTLTCSLWVIDDIFESTTSPLDTLSKNFTELFRSKRGCDVTLKVQHREFPAHQCILSARSTVFAAMLEADMKDNETGVVEIVDCDPEAFEDFLTFLYSAKFEKNTEFNKVFELYRIAEKYSVEELKLACGLYMMRFITVDNVCYVAILGDQYDNGPLTEKAKIFFNENFAEIINTTSWNFLLKSNENLVNQLLKNMASVSAKKL